MREAIIEVSGTLKALGLKMAAENVTIPLQDAARASCILLAKLQPHVEKEEFGAACKLIAALLNSHSLTQMMVQQEGRTVTETVESRATGNSAT